MQPFARTFLGFIVAALVLITFVLLRGASESETSAGILPSERVEGAMTSAADLTASTGDIETAEPTAESPPADARVVAEPGTTFDGYRITGRVVDARGIIVRNSTVRWWEHDLMAMQDPDFELEVEEGVIDDEGSFGFEFKRPGEYRIWARAPERVPSEVYEVVLDAQSPVAVVEVMLPDPLAITGVLLDGGHEPVEDIEVIAYVDVERGGGELPLGVTSVEYFGRPTAKSREDGAFWLYPVRPTLASYVVQAQRTASSSGTSTSAARTVVTTIGSNESVTLTLPELNSRIASLEYAVQPQVSGGASGVELVFQASRSAESSVSVALTVPSAAQLPGGIWFTLSHVGPRGGIFHTHAGLTKLDDQGVALITGLFTGARYDLRLRSEESGWEHSFDTFVARSGVMALDANVPGLYAATFLIHDPHEKLDDRTDLRVLARDEIGRRRIASSGTLGERRQVTLQVCSGPFRVQMYSGWNRLVGEDFEMPEGPATFTIEVP